MTAATSAEGFPPGFLWGVSTSAYQIEGAAAQDGRGPSIWDTRCRVPGGVVNGDTGDVACDHYHRYAEDIALMRGLGVGAYRFSVAWPRVLPRGRGAPNDKGLDFYDRLIDAVLEAGIEPWLCLYHWDLPQSLHDLGGWANRDVAGWFADYAVLVARRYGDRVKHFATVNEPSVFTLFGYAIPWAAPGITDRAMNLRAIHHVNLAHGAGVDVLRDHVPGVSIGAIHNCQPVIPATDSEADREAAAFLDEHWNLAFPDPQLLGRYPSRLAALIEPHMQAGDMARICRPTDWIGLNHYGPIFAKADASTTWGFGWADLPDGAEDHGIGWPVFPEMFRDELVRLTRRYRLPVYVAENGCSGNDTPDANGAVDDPRRIRYLTLYTDAMRDAMRAGADVRGYFVWSLLDSFEWGSGYGPRFGLVHVDFPTGTRTPKSSARWYAELIRRSRTVAA
ncbi:beta-glucosidase [Azospirillum sp. RWY-5-1]|uniref:Beta-glucosidase n=1 Tax=Azospirillum oleiclasticum TaxID=2735135 RepID=A0ABX2T9F6_9PROT|nr:GH1 family beta-glucosidase [Azospirillum oleiclasticum]NYZ12449.1 beta-glucosidase [Azospirillum oleiclasticum]NYZ19609.1 beta-glucosidase [Azospirillum oleiclasticum]